MKQMQIVIALESNVALKITIVGCDCLEISFLGQHLLISFWLEDINFQAGLSQPCVLSQLLPSQDQQKLDATLLRHEFLNGPGTCDCNGVNDAGLSIYKSTDWREPHQACGNMDALLPDHFGAYRDGSASQRLQDYVDGHHTCPYIDGSCRVPQWAYPD